MIEILPPPEARKIAAGEVIDRPSALIREFLDNAIDAGGQNIEVYIDEGGIGRVEVADDGSGMEREDLEICYYPHATSKIRSIDDLKKINSLGFRGEALAAAAAVSRFEVLTSSQGDRAWKLTVGPAEKNTALIEGALRVKGTSVRSFGLFDNIPARKRFLKRPGSEALSCRQVFNEKALAFPALAFKFTQDGVLKCFLPPVSSFRERFAQVFLEEREAQFLHEINSMGSGFTVSIIVGGPELYRRDRRLQFVFANRRRINNFALLQALEYGLQGLFPGGTQPIGAIFLEIDPALADFNIHPAKREARFTDPGAIHHAVSSSLRNFARFLSHGRHGEFDHTELTESTELTEGRLELAIPLNSAATRLFESVSSVSLCPPCDQIHIDEKAPEYTVSRDIKFIGRLFGLFIIIERGEQLFIIDQHAAHERVLFDRYQKAPVPVQELLVPIPFSTESPEEDAFLEGRIDELQGLGIIIKKSEGEWQIEGLPAGLGGSDTEIVEEILKLKDAGAKLTEHWLTCLSCRKAVKDGDFLDEGSALALIEELFTLPSRRCPHGRPIYFEMSRDELLKFVKRKV